jgi:hypothetical protein
MRAATSDPAAARQGAGRLLFSFTSSPSSFSIFRSWMYILEELALN